MTRVDGRNPDLRVSDAERDAVASELGRHFEDGRLDQAEFDERVGAAIAAKTHGDLDSLLADLPQGPAGHLGVRTSRPEQAAAPDAGPWHPAQPGLRSGRPALVAVLPLLLAMAVLGGLFSHGWQHGWPFAPFGFLWLIVPIVVLSTCIRIGRRRRWR